LLREPGTPVDNYRGIVCNRSLKTPEGYSEFVNKGNNKITELRTILKGKVKTHEYINRQNQSATENCEKE
jgi:hypothetical protein